MYLPKQNFIFADRKPKVGYTYDDLIGGAMLAVMVILFVIFANVY